MGGNGQKQSVFLFDLFVCSIRFVCVVCLSDCMFSLLVFGVNIIVLKTKLYLNWGLNILVAIGDFDLELSPCHVIPVLFLNNSIELV